MSLESQIAELDATIATNSKLVNKAKAYERLCLNPDFKELILEGYFNKEAVRLVHAKAGADMQTPDKQAKIITQMDSIGNLSDYLNAIRQQGEVASKGLNDAEIDRAAWLNGEYE